MPYKIREFQETPNPNALKCLVDRRLAEKPRSYFKAADAALDPLAAALFSISGVTNVLINADWVTVSKKADADWKAIRRAVERVLNEAV